MRHFPWNAAVVVALCLTGCKSAEREIVDQHLNATYADAPLTKAESWCRAKLAEAKLKLPTGFAIRECTTGSVDFLRSEKGLGPIWLGKRQPPLTKIYVAFAAPPQGLLEGPVISVHGQISAEKFAAEANGGPNHIPDVNGLRKAMEPPTGWDTNEGADVFKYYYFNEDRTIFCEGFIRESLRCGIHGGRYFMIWSYSGRDIENSLKQMLVFRETNT